MLFMYSSDFISLQQVVVNVLPEEHAKNKEVFDPSTSKPPDHAVATHNPSVIRTQRWLD